MPPYHTVRMNTLYSISYCSTPILQVVIGARVDFLKTDKKTTGENTKK